MNINHLDNEIILIPLSYLSLEDSLSFLSVDRVIRQLFHVFLERRVSEYLSQNPKDLKSSKEHLLVFALNVSIVKKMNHLALKILDSQKKIGSWEMSNPFFRSIQENNLHVTQKILEVYGKNIGSEVLVYGLETAIDKGCFEVSLELVLRLRKVDLGAIFLRLIEKSSIEIARKILESAERIDPEMLGFGLLSAIELENWAIAFEILRSRRNIGWEPLGISLCFAIEKENHSLVEEILSLYGSFHRTDDQNSNLLRSSKAKACSLGHALHKAFEKRNQAMIEMILDSDNAIDSKLLGSFLQSMIEERNDFLVKKILNSDRSIHQKEFELSFQMAVEFSYHNVIQDFFEGTRVILKPDSSISFDVNPELIGSSLFQAVKGRDVKMVQALLDFCPKIDPEELGSNFQAAVRRNFFEIVESFLGSKHELSSSLLVKSLEEYLPDTDKQEMSSFLLILNSEKSIDSKDLGNTLVSFVLLKKHDLAEKILDSSRLIDRDSLEDAEIFSESPKIKNKIKRRLDEI